MSTDVDFSDLRAHWAKSGIREKAERLSWSTPAMEVAHKAYIELREEGWRPAMYCPKDGTVFLAWSPDQVMPYRCKYDGVWPKGRWWAMADGDLWPDSPVLWKALPDESNKRVEEGDA